MKEDYYKLIIKNAPTGFAGLEVVFGRNDEITDYRIEETNGLFWQLSGLKPVEIPVESVRKLYLSEIRLSHDWMDLLNKAAVSQKEIQVERHNIITDRWLRVIIKSAEKARLLLFLIDITDYRQLLDSHREEFSLRQFLFEYGKDGLVVLDKNHKVIDVNSQFCEMLGYSPEELKTMYTWDFEAVMPEKEIKAEFANDTLLNATFEGHHRRKDGSVYNVEVSARSYDWKGQRLVFCSCRDITERKKAELQLQNSQRKYRNLVENLNDVLYTLNEDGIIIYMSPVMEQISGFRCDEYIGKHFSTFIHPDFVDQIKNDFEKLKQGEIYSSEYRIQTKVGNEIWVRSSTKPYMSENNQIEYIGLAEDITNERKTELEIRESALKLKMALKVAGMGYWRFDPETNKLEWSSEDDALFGLTNIEFPVNFEILTNLVHPDDRKSALQTLLKAVNDRNPFELSCRIIRPDGEIRWVKTNGIPLETDPKRKNLIFGITIDITDEKMTQMKLEHQTKLRELLFEISTNYINLPLEKVDTEIIFSLEKIAQFVSADRSYIFMYDWEKQICTNTFEWCRKGIEPQIDNLQHVPLEMMPDWVKEHQQGKPVFVPDVSLLLQGKVREILEPQKIKSVISVPLMQNKICIGFVGFDYVIGHHQFTDTETQLLQLYVQLIVNIISRRRYELEINAAREKAEENNRLKTAFINNISHEIRTPLNGILGFGELMTDENLSPDDRQFYFETLQASTGRLTQTVTDYMDISKIASRTMEVNTSDFLVNDLMTDIKEKAKKLTARKPIEVKLELPKKSDNLVLHADYELLQKSFYHLLTNAEKFTREGSITVGYELMEEEIKFFVKDTGKGISQQKLKVIFDVFMQEDPSLTRGYEGSGLGLAIVKGLVTLQGGKVWVDSTSGEGSSFYILIPRHNLLTSKESEFSLKTIRKTFEKPVVLITEDIETNYAFMRIVLNKAGYDVIHASNGAEAVEFCKKQQEISIVLMDMKMPVMSGMEATKRIKSFRNDLPVIAVTAYAHSGEDQLLYDAGCEGILPKPFTRQELLATINKFVKATKKQ
ncbi:MAG: PAS domain S-box protein [Sphingobacteriia bacterium]|nr:PAS domain S-box protein [Sphingobacteriia bacterium]